MSTPYWQEGLTDQLGAVQLETIVQLEYGVSPGAACRVTVTVGCMPLLRGQALLMSLVPWHLFCFDAKAPPEARGKSISE